MFWIDLSTHKGKGSSTTNVQTYTPTEQEIRLQEQAADYAEAVAPNALELNKKAAELLFGSLGDTQVDYNKLLADAQGQITSAQQGVADLSQGKLPEEYQKNMEASIQSGVENSMGSMLDSLGSRGVLSSSVTNNATNDISKNIANTMAQQYQNNIGILNGLYGQQASLAGQNIATSAAAQEAAQAPALNLWNASLGLNSGGTLGALQAMGNQGTTTTTSSASGGGGLFGGILTGLAGNAGLFCFSEDVKIATPTGDKFIRHVKTGDEVISFDPVTGEESQQIVLDVLTPRYEDVYIITCEDEKNNKKYVSCTLTQPLLTSEGDFREVAILRIGTELKNAGKVKGIAFSGNRKVYDLKVTGANTYYANGFVAKGGSNEW